MYSLLYTISAESPKIDCWFWRTKIFLPPTKTTTTTTHPLLSRENKIKYPVAECCCSNIRSIASHSFFILVTYYELLPGKKKHPSPLPSPPSATSHYHHMSSPSSPTLPRTTTTMFRFLTAGILAMMVTMILHMVMMQHDLFTMTIYGTISWDELHSRQQTLLQQQNNNNSSSSSSLSSLLSSSFWPNQHQQQHQHLLLEMEKVKMEAIQVNQKMEKLKLEMAQLESASAAMTTTTTTTPSIGACLMILDDNHWLIEWLAYHYHVLPLRHLIVLNNDVERARTSPLDILHRWKGRIDITVWNTSVVLAQGAGTTPRVQQALQQLHSANTTTTATTTANNNKNEETMARIIFHREIQKHFYYQCANAFQQTLPHVKWVMMTDTDEFAQVNSHHEAYRSEAHAPSQPGSVLQFLQQQQEQEQHSHTANHSVHITPLPNGTTVSIWRTRKFEAYDGSLLYRKYQCRRHKSDRFGPIDDTLFHSLTGAPEIW